MYKIDIHKFIMVKILGKHVSITQQPPNSRTDTFMGRMDDAMNSMVINSEMPDQNKSETILHESIEYINSQLELELTHKQISALSMSMYQFINDNIAEI